MELVRSMVSSEVQGLIPNSSHCRQNSFPTVLPLMEVPLPYGSHSFEGRFRVFLVVVVLLFFKGLTY